MKPLRIAQIAPLYESVPPKTYGGTERVVSYLTDELVRQGHDVTLFASGDSRTLARLVAPCARSLRLDPDRRDPLAQHLVLIEEVYRRADEFDLVHFHVDYLHFPASSRHRFPHLTTLHGRLDMPDLVPLYEAYPGMPVVSISNAQREPLPWLDWQGTVYHGLPDLLQGSEEAGGYLAFLGRISPEKRPDLAIDIARRAGLPLRIAAKVDAVDTEYHAQVIRPKLSEADVELVGEIDERGKQDFLGRARALLFPIDWPEPFGLVLIEAMACGTPVIAFRRGAVAEILNDGETGFIVGSVEEAVGAVGRLPEISRRRCRQAFERRFTAARMARDYVEIYHRQLEGLVDGRDHSGQRPVLHSGHQLARR